MIRNAGGRASDDAIRSLVISYKLLGTREWFVIHHTDCGMLLFANDDMREEILLDSSPNNRQKIVSRSTRQPDAAKILNCVLAGRRFAVYLLDWAFSSRTSEMRGFSG